MTAHSNGEKAADKSENIADVHVWTQATSGLWSNDRTKMLSLLSAEERMRCDRFVVEEARRDFAVAHALLRHALSAYEAGVRPDCWTFETEPTGKPRVSDGLSLGKPIEFSLSHTRDFVACAVAPLRVGLDVERVRAGSDVSEIASRYFAESEQDALRRLAVPDRAALFTELWTLKEAYLKGLGWGIADRLADVAFAAGEEATCIAAPEDAHPHEWLFERFKPRADLRMAIAVHASGRLHVVRHEGIFNTSTSDSEG